MGIGSALVTPWIEVKNRFQNKVRMIQVFVTLFLSSKNHFLLFWMAIKRHCFIKAQVLLRNSWHTTHGWLCFLRIFYIELRYGGFVYAALEVFVSQAFGKWVQANVEERSASWWKQQPCLQAILCTGRVIASSLKEVWSKLFSMSPTALSKIRVFILWQNLQHNQLMVPHCFAINEASNVLCVLIHRF